jgi:hypothetical protein
MYFSPTFHRTTDFNNVFQHFADDTVGQLKTTILATIWRSINREDDDYPRMEDTLQTVSPRHFKDLRGSICPNLYYGSFNLTKTRTLSHEIVWKWTEASGKFVGCQFWSINAKKLFDEELRRRFGNTPTFDRAWNLAIDLSSTTRYGRQALNHEHVLPIATIRKVLLKPTLYAQFANSEARLKEFFERAVVGCIMLKEEHDAIHSRPENWDNSWLRYKGSSIKLMWNPNWSDVHQQMIKEANLL